MRLPRSRLALMTGDDCGERERLCYGSVSRDEEDGRTSFLTRPFVENVSLLHRTSLLNPGLRVVKRRTSLAIEASTFEILPW
jgi:hypothetical protein